MATNFLNLDLPTVSVTIGPEYATQNNTAFEVIDEHDHSSGKGKSIPASALNINDNINFNSNNAYNLLQVKLISNLSPLTGAANANSIYISSGDLYYTNSSGSAVQITDGGSVVTSAGALQTVEVQSISSDVIIAPADTFVFLDVDTTAARSITLPLANAVAGGRIYIIKDKTGSANTYNITVNRAGSDLIDGDTSFVYDSNLGSFWVIGDGDSNWRIA